MNRIQAAALAARIGADYMRLVNSGQADPSTFWYATSGARRFVTAIAAGDLAPDAVIQRRRAACKSCSKRVRLTIRGDNAPSDWCGAVAAPAGGGCGCHLLGKTSVASESCPIGEWGESERA